VKYILIVDCSMENAINIAKQNKQDIYFLLSISLLLSIAFSSDCGPVSTYELETSSIPDVF